MSECRRSGGQGQAHGEGRAADRRESSHEAYAAAFIRRATSRTTPTVESRVCVRRVSGGLGPRRPRKWYRTLARSLGRSRAQCQLGGGTVIETDWRRLVTPSLLHSTALWPPPTTSMPMEHPARCQTVRPRSARPGVLLYDAVRSWIVACAHQVVALIDQCLPCDHPTR